MFYPKIREQQSPAEVPFELPIENSKSKQMIQFQFHEHNDIIWHLE